MATTKRRNTCSRCGGRHRAPPIPRPNRRPQTRFASQTTAAATTMAPRNAGLCVTCTQRGAARCARTPTLCGATAGGRRLSVPFWVPYSQREAATFLERERVEWLRACANATLYRPSSTLVFSELVDANRGAVPAGMRVAERAVTIDRPLPYTPFSYRPSLAGDSSVVHPNESRECVAWQPWRVWTLAQAFEHQGDAYWHDVIYEFSCPTMAHFVATMPALSFGVATKLHGGGGGGGGEGGARAFARDVLTALAALALPRSTWWYVSTAPYVRTDPWLALLLLERAIAGDLAVLVHGIRRSHLFGTWVAACIIEASLLFPLRVGSGLVALVFARLGAWPLVAFFVWRSTALAPLTARLWEVIRVETAILAMKVA